MRVAVVIRSVNRGAIRPSGSDGTGCAIAALVWREIDMQGTSGRRSRGFAMCVGVVASGMPGWWGDGAAVAATPIRAATAVVLEGDIAPGTDRIYQRFDRPYATRDQSGPSSVAMTADLAGPADDDDVLYVDQGLELREGHSVAGVGIITDIRPFRGGPPVSDAGSIAIVEVETGGGELIDAVVLNGRIVAAEGDLVPDGLGDRYESFTSVGVCDDGRIGIHARTTGPTASNDVIVFGESVRYRKGDAVSWDASLHWDGRFDEVAWNRRGDMLFEGNTSGPVATDRVLVREWTGEEGERLVEVVAREGDAFVSEKGPVVLDLVEQAVLADSGAWAARALARDASAALDEFVFDERGLIVREGDPVAGIGDAFVGHPFAIAVDDAGRVATAAQLTGSRPAGVDEAIIVGGEALTVTGIEARGLAPGSYLAWIGFEDLSGIGDGRFVFTAGYGGSVAGDGIFEIRAEARCHADLDGDGAVDGVDLVLLLGVWGPCDRILCPPDLDGDGAVAMGDLVSLLGAWGTCAD